MTAFVTPENLSIARATSGWARSEEAVSALGTIIGAYKHADPLAFLELEEVFTPRLGASARFRIAFADAARELTELGSLGALERRLAAEVGRLRGSPSIRN